MARILVTGAGGLLGSSLVPHLRDHGHHVLTWIRAGGDVEGDLTDANAVRHGVERVEPEVLINLAAITDVDACEREPQRAYLGNVRIAENLARAIRTSAPEARLVQVSTDQVYDGPGPHIESAVTLINYYGFSKYAAELAVEPVSAMVLRTNFFGKSERPGRPSFSDWLFTSLSAGKSITVFEDVQFSPLSIRTLVALLERAARDVRPGVFNVGSRDGMSKADFAAAFAAAVGLPTASMRHGRSADVALTAPRPTDMRMDLSRFEQTYGARLPSLSEEIHRTAQDYGEHTR